MAAEGIAWEEMLQTSLWMDNHHTRARRLYERSKKTSYQPAHKEKRTQLKKPIIVQTRELVKEIEDNSWV